MDAIARLESALSSPADSWVVNQFMRACGLQAGCAICATFHLYFAVLEAEASR